MNGLRGLKALTSANLVGVANYFNLPTIGGLYSTNKTLLSRAKEADKKALVAVLQMLDMFKFGIPIYPDTYEESGGNEISEQVLVGGLGSDASEGGESGADIAGALVKVADNIVVNPRKWRIHGYTGLNMNTTVGNFALGMYPVIPEVTIRSFVQKFGRDTLNNTFRQTLQYIAEARRPFKFNTREGETIPCLIKSYNIKTVAENNNYVELDLELQEFRFLALSDDMGNQSAVGGVTSTFSVAKLGRTALRALIF